MSSYGAVSLIPGSLPTYSAASAFTTMAASTTDGFEIYFGSKIVRVLAIYAAFRGTNGSVDAWILKRSTANSSGTSTTETGVPFDSSNGAATAVVKTYTANPTTGTSVGRIKGLSMNTASASISYGPTPEGAIILYEAPSLGQAVTLRASGEGLVVNFNGTAPTGGTFAFTVIWTESDT